MRTIDRAPAVLGRGIEQPEGHRQSSGSATTWRTPHAATSRDLTRHLPASVNRRPFALSKSTHKIIFGRRRVPLLATILGGRSRDGSKDAMGSS
jgi:hypothetical protein